jgi:hypothetical protein
MLFSWQFHLIAKEMNPLIWVAAANPSTLPRNGNGYHSLFGTPGRPEHTPQSDNSKIMALLIQAGAGVSGR